MDKIAELAEQGIKPLLKRDWKKIGELMNENNRLRNQLCNYLKSDIHAMEYALACGAYGVKVSGSGGSVIVLCDDKNIEEVFRKVNKIYPCLRPEIAFGMN